MATWRVELLVAGLLLAVAAIVVADSLRIGIGWGLEGPQAGFFPFYVGLVLAVAAGVTFASNLVPVLRSGESFVSRDGVRRILAILVPAVLFVAAVPWLGIYLAAALLIAFFMRVHGGYGAARTAAVAIGIALVLFLVFELWFVTPLPKGPLEAALGF